jgi:cytochrome bd ubiquinol oxidase subunit II
LKEAHTETLWFWLVAMMIAVYAVLDGFDFGAGIVHLFIARTDAERAAVLAAVGPVWDGNEVWLLAGGGVLFFAFPAVYASGFEGFYLPLMVVLWLLILRGIAIEFRNKISSLVWHPFWDVVFAGASALLAIFFGAATGNVVRGVPLDGSGFFFLPLWANLRLFPVGGILDWFTIIIGLGSLAALAVHGSLWLVMKTPDAIAARARTIADTGWWAVAAITALLAIIVPLVQPHISFRFQEAPWGFVFPAAAAVGLLAVKALNRAGRAAGAFLASCVYIAGMLSSAAFGLFPYLLPSSAGAGAGLTVYNSAASTYGLTAGLCWFIPGMALVAVYFIFVYRRMATKVALGEETY